MPSIVGGMISFQDSTWNRQPVADLHGDPAPLIIIGGGEIRLVTVEVRRCPEWGDTQDRGGVTAANPAPAI